MPEGEARDVAGRRYALAIMAFLDDDESAADAWTEAVDALDALTSDGSYVAALQGDGLTDEAFQEIVRRVLPDIGETQLNLLRLLRRKNRLALGPSIASYYRELLDERRGVARAVVRTAVEIDDDRRERFSEELARRTGRTVELETEVDPDLIGGAVIRIGDRLIDGSTRAALRGLRQRLEQGTL